MASQHLDNLLSTLSSATLQNWKKIKRTNKQHQKRLAGLLRLKAFQGNKFTENEQYQRGKSQLEVTRQMQFKGNADAKVQRFRQLMGTSSLLGPKKEYLNRDALNCEEVKEAFRHFKRPFGEVDSVVFTNELCTPQRVEKADPPRKPGTVLHSDTNKYIVRRMQTIFRCNTLSKETLLRLTASEMQSPNFIRRSDQLPVVTLPDGKTGKRLKGGKRKLGRKSSGLVDRVRSTEAPGYHHSAQLSNI